MLMFLGKIEWRMLMFLGKTELDNSFTVSSTGVNIWGVWMLALWECSE
jgi:hypothetical protein